jgi:hypothetical protein
MADYAETSGPKPFGKSQRNRPRIHKEAETFDQAWKNLVPEIYEINLSSTAPWEVLIMTFTRYTDAHTHSKPCSD